VILSSIVLASLQKDSYRLQAKIYDEVFAPVSNHATFTMLLSLVANGDLDLHHIDIQTAFTHGDLKEEIYMMPPPFNHLLCIQPHLHPTTPASNHTCTTTHSTFRSRSS
jgi:hypothetical protein